MQGHWVEALGPKGLLEGINAPDKAQLVTSCWTRRNNVLLKNHRQKQNESKDLWMIVFDLVSHEYHMIINLEFKIPVDSLIQNLILLCRSTCDICQALPMEPIVNCCELRVLLAWVNMLWWTHFWTTNKVNPHQRHEPQSTVQWLFKRPQGDQGRCPLRIRMVWKMYSLARLGSTQLFQ